MKTEKDILYSGTIGIAALQSQTIEAVLRQAFELGQIYWQQANSDKQNALSDETRLVFENLVLDTLARSLPLRAPPITQRVKITENPITIDFLRKALAVIQRSGNGGSPNAIWMQKIAAHALFPEQWPHPGDAP